MWCEICPKDCPYKSAYLKKYICSYAYITNNLRDCPVGQDCKRYKEWIKRGKPDVILECKERRDELEKLRRKFFKEILL